jgi:tetratricopeptide (TPR) repeat protein
VGFCERLGWGADEGRRIEHAQILEMIVKLEELGYRDPQEERLAAELERISRRNGYNLARSLMEGREVEQACDVLEGLVEKSSLQRPVVALLIEAYLMLGWFDKARDIVEKLRAEDPGAPLVELSLGRIELGCGNPRLAAQLLEKAVNARGGDARAWVFLGQALMRLDQCGEARAAFQRAVEIDPDNPDATAALAEAVNL